MSIAPPFTGPTDASSFVNITKGQDFSEQGIVNVCMRMWQESREYSRSVLDRLPSLYNAFSVVNTGDVASYRNNIGLPLLVSMVLTDTARQANAIFGGPDIIDFVGCPAEKRAIAKKNSILVSNQLHDSRSFVKGVDFLNNAHLYGTAIARVGWTYLERMRNFRVETPMGIQVMSRPTIVRDGPDWENIDLADFGPQPNKKYIQSMDRIQFRYYEDYDTLVEMDQSHRSRFGVSLFAPGALEKLANRRAPTAEDLRLRRYGQNPSLANAKNNPSTYSKPVEIIETIGLFPREFAVDGDRNRVVLVANGHTLLRNDANPYWNGLKPAVVYCPAPDPQYFYGIGKGVLIEPLQNAASRLVNQKLDIMDFAVNPMSAVNINKFPNIANLNSKPGKLIPINGNPADVFMPIQHNFAGVQHAFQEVAELREFAQMAVGISEAGTMGIGANGDMTAREYLGRQEAANTRLGLEAQLASVFVGELAEWYRDLNQQHLSLPAQIKLIGNAAFVDPDTGLPFEDPNMGTIVADDLVHTWQARAIGPLALVSQGLQRQDAMQLMQMLSANPVAMQMVSWATFTRRIFKLFPGFDDPAMLVEQVPQINQMAAQAGMSPEQLAQQEMAGMVGPQGGAGGQSLTNGDGSSTDSILSGGA